MNRKITVLIESTQSKVMFESNATTLGELKNELRERQVSYDLDCVFKEAASKTILTSDASILPSNIPWKGQVTNDLVFMVTAPQKKIRSGTMDRKEAYSMVKKLGLQEEIQRREGKNFTQCSTALLISYIEKNSRFSKKEEKYTAKPVSSAPIAKEKGIDTKDCLKNLLDEMVSKGVLMQHDADNIWNVANGQSALPVEKEQSYEELAKQFDF